MGQNAVLKDFNLDDLLFKKEIIESVIEKREHIFELKNADSSLGFISLFDLKAYLNSTENDCESFSVRNIDLENFTPIFEHPLFQRRKPQVIETVTEEIVPTEQHYHIVKHGQKNGPFTKLEIDELLTNKEIILNDMISINNGETWLKVYAAPGFDRRELKATNNLPRLPDEDFLKAGPADLRYSDEITEATSSLAYLGYLKKGKVANLDHAQLDLKADQKNKFQNTKYKWLFAISFIGIAYFLYNINTALQSPLSDSLSSNGLGEKVEMLSPADINDPTINQNSRPRNMGKFQTRPMNPVQPRTRIQQKSFRQANPNLLQGEPINNDANYYYDNSSPMELDPVREQVSRETFDEAAPISQGEMGEPGLPPADDALFNQESSN